MESCLIGVGYYVSPVGGAPNPATIGADTILFELITAGSVYSPSKDALRGPGWVFCHHPGEETIWNSEPDDHYECAVLRFTLSGTAPREEWPRSFFWGDEAGAVSFAREMLYASHHTAVPADILGNLIWSQLRFRLDHFRRQEIGREVPSRIARVMSYIDNNYAREIGIDELAREATLSPSHLHSCFREVAGMTPHQYLIEQRMRVARHRLVTTLDPIKEIAADVGYASTENFCRAFKSRFTFTAAAYRRKYSIA